MIKNIYLSKSEEDFFRLISINKLNFNRYVKTLILEDVKKRKRKDSLLLRQIKLFEYEQQKKQYLENIKLLGAVNNIDNRIKNMSNNNTRAILIKQILNLLNTEKSNIKDKDVKKVITDKIKFLEGVLNIGRN